jgi:hypothetical protein
MSGLMGALAIMLGFTVMAALNGVVGHSHGGGEHHDHGHGHVYHDTQDVDIHEKYQNFPPHGKVENIEGLRNPYDHFHEEYDLDHGDHTHHIGSHHIHANKSEEFDDELLDKDVIFDTKDFENEDQEQDNDDKEDGHYHKMNQVPNIGFDENEHEPEEPHHLVEKSEHDHDIYHHHHQQVNGDIFHDTHDFHHEHYSEYHRHTNQSGKQGILKVEHIADRQENVTVTAEHITDHRAGHHSHQHVDNGY